MIHVVLVEPRIPQNVGNIARLCAAMNSPLHLVEPLGFFLNDKRMKRAGLDYWPHVKLHTYDSFPTLLERNPGGRFFYLTTRGQKSYTSASFLSGDFIVFGDETSGLSASIIDNSKDMCFKIPMDGPVRCLNLSTSVAIVLSEALRQVTQL